MGQRGIIVDRIMAAQAIDAGSTSYTSAINSNNLVGTYAGILVGTNATGTLLIKQQCSLDGITFYDPTNATSVAVGTIYQSLFTVTTSKYIQFTPVIAPYIRFSVNAVVAAQTITVDYLSQGERA